jgi:hypothetical protein
MSLLLTNSDGFVNFEQLELHEDASKAHESARSEPRDSLHATEWHQAGQGQAHAWTGSSRNASVSVAAYMRAHSQQYSPHSADARYHIDSQDIFGPDFVENRAKHLMRCVDAVLTPGVRSLPPC